MRIYIYIYIICVEDPIVLGDVPPSSGCLNGPFHRDPPVQGAGAGRKAGHHERAAQAGWLRRRKIGAASPGIQPLTG